MFGEHIRRNLQSGAVWGVAGVSAPLWDVFHVCRPAARRTYSKSPLF